MPDRLEQACDVVGVGLSIGRNHPDPRGRADGNGLEHAVSEAFVHLDAMEDDWQALGDEASDDLTRAVAAAVVADHQLETGPRLPEGLHELRDRVGDDLLLVEARHDERHIRPDWLGWTCWRGLDEERLVDRHGVRYLTPRSGSFCRALDNSWGQVPCPAKPLSRTPPGLLGAIASHPEVGLCSNGSRRTRARHVRFAALAQKLGSQILTETMEFRREIGSDS